MIILGMMVKQTGSYKHRKNKSNRKRPVGPTAVEKHDGQTDRILQDLWDPTTVERMIISSMRVKQTGC